MESKPSASSICSSPFKSWYPIRTRAWRSISSVTPGIGDTAFRVADPIGGFPNDLRVDVGPDAIRGGEFDHDETPKNTDMRGRDSDPRRRVHRVQEIGRKQSKRLVKVSHTPGYGAKAGVRKTENRPHGQGSSSHPAPARRTTFG